MVICIFCIMAATNLYIFSMHANTHIAMHYGLAGLMCTTASLLRVYIPMNCCLHIFNLELSLPYKEKLAICLLILAFRGLIKNLIILLPWFLFILSIWLCFVKVFSNHFTVLLFWLQMLHKCNAHNIALFVCATYIELLLDKMNRFERSAIYRGAWL